jgi:transcriptional regulator with XRE-family HTH domain
MDGKELKELRIKLGLTQTQMAERLFVSRDAIAKYEAGGNIREPVQELARRLTTYSN